MGQKSKTHVDAVLKTLSKNQTKTMNSVVLSSRKAVVARPANSRRSALTRAVRNGSRVNMAGMQVLRPEKKYECLSYLPPLSDEDIAKQVVYLVNQGWSPCIEFSSQELADTTQLFFAGPSLNEIEECQKEYPGCRVRVVGFDRVRQVQMAGFIARKSFVLTIITLLAML